MIYRGLILNPQSSKKCDFYLDGGLFVKNGKVAGIGNFSKLIKKNKNEKIVDTKSVIIPAFTDIHLHWVQNRVKGSFSGTLLPWLKKHIWPEESKFAEKKYSDKMVGKFYKELAKNGTRNAIIYSSVHKYATEKSIIEGKKNGNFIIGNVLMDQNSPEYLQISTKEEIKIVESLAKKYKNAYVITPRFAPTCSMELMEKVADIAKKYGCFIQTHLSENKDELSWVKALFPVQKSYTDVYYKAGLLGKHTVLGHCIHLSDDELKLLKKTGSKIAHCPTSNVALKSGTMPIEKILKYKIPFALATDIGAGPKLSMIDVMKAYLKVHQSKFVTPIDALYRATLAGTEIMEISKNHGNLNKGKFAEFVIIPKKDLKLQGMKNISADQIIRAFVNLDNLKIKMHV
ncbi:MAG: guanine deaminase [Candidatus Gracilibacteria bacterium]